jgi:hypothetical protein
MRMFDALVVTWQSLKDFWDEFALLIMLNIIWSLSVVLAVAPLFLWGSTNPLLALASSLVLLFPLPIVSGALCFVTNQVARDKAIGWGTFATGLRRYWLKSLIVALINLVILGLIAFNIQFYAFAVTGAWTAFAVIAWVVVAILWLIIQIYWFPMILELESEKVLLALRNALGLMLLSPGFSLMLAMILAILATLCILLTAPAPLLMASLLLLISNHATRHRLDHIRQKHLSRETDEPEVGQ